MFDITSGVIIILLHVFIFTYMYQYIRKSFYLGDKHCITILRVASLLCGGLCTVFIFMNYLFSFVSIVREVYVVGANTNGCKSPAFYSAFSYVTTEFILLLLGLLLIIIIVHFKVRRRR